MSENPVVPVWIAGLICDSANFDPHTGKKNLIGVFDRLWAKKFPTKRWLSVYLKITDAQGSYKLSTKLYQSASNLELVKAELDVEIKDRKMSTDYLIQFPFMIEIPEAGRYEFRFFANEAYLGSATLDAEPRE